jgi:hypothetical protein
MPVIPALRGRIRQKDREFEATLSYIAARPCLKKGKEKKTKGSKLQTFVIQL